MNDYYVAKIVETMEQDIINYRRENNLLKKENEHLKAIIKNIQSYIDKLEREVQK